MGIQFLFYRRLLCCIAGVMADEFDDDGELNRSSVTGSKLAWPPDIV
jgi:hypothetical protein